ncbi:MAG: hypothetical protein KJ906_01600 [Nanoarchaeota archaeon]|nr:hypothetical protein [Nanoarchaeota archaeon]
MKSKLFQKNTSENVRIEIIQSPFGDDGIEIIGEPSRFYNNYILNIPEKILSVQKTLGIEECIWFGARKITDKEYILEDFYIPKKQEIGSVTGKISAEENCKTLKYFDHSGLRAMMLGHKHPTDYISPSNLDIKEMESRPGIIFSIISEYNDKIGFYCLKETWRGEKQNISVELPSSAKLIERDRNSSIFGLYEIYQI